MRNKKNKVNRDSVYPNSKPSENSSLIAELLFLFIGTSILFLIFKDLNFVDDTIHIPLAPLIFGTGFFYVEVFC